MNTNNLKWHQKPAGVIALLILCCPVGLYLMWKNKLWTPKTRGAVTIVVAALVVLGGGVPSDSDKYTRWTNKFDKAKATNCKCVERARKIRNIEKSDKEQRECLYQFRLFYNEFEDASGLSDSLFAEIDSYIQREFNTPCK